VDSSGATLDFLLSAERDAAAAKRFLAKALGRQNHPVPRRISFARDFVLGDTTKRFIHQLKCSIFLG
jgi:transposase-like protein